jgi:general secretion pathway protein D
LPTPQKTGGKLDMKTRILTLTALTFCVASLVGQEKGATKLMSPDRAPAGPKETPTYSSFDRPDARSEQEPLPKGGLVFEEADVTDVLKIYQELSGRSVVRPGTLPSVRITFKNETGLTRREALQVLDTLLAANGLAMVLQGTKQVKAVPVGQAPSEAAPLIDLPPDQLPESSSYMMYIVEVKHRRPNELGIMLQQFSKTPNSIIAMKETNVLILRDYSSNIRRMLQVLERIDREE